MPAAWQWPAWSRGRAAKACWHGRVIDRRVFPGSHSGDDRWSWSPVRIGPKGCQCRRATAILAVVSSWSRGMRATTRVGGWRTSWRSGGACVQRHRPFDQWGRFLPEHTTAVSLLDRLLHHSIVVVTEGESFRMRQARSQGGARMKKA